MVVSFRSVIYSSGENRERCTGSDFDTLLFHYGHEEALLIEHYSLGSRDEHIQVCQSWQR